MNIKKLKTIYSKIEGLKADLEEIHEKATETFENRSDKWRDSDAGQNEEQRISHLEEAISEIDSLLENLDNAAYDENA